MKHFRSPLLWLLLLLGTTAAMIVARAPAALAASTSAAPANKLKWDEKFAGVVHDATNIRGFVDEYRWLSNFFLNRVEWEGRVYSSAEAAYQSGKYPPAERDVFTTLDPGPSKKLADINPYDRAVWAARKERTMREVVWAKFSQNPELGKPLVVVRFFLHIVFQFALSLIVLCRCAESVVLLILIGSQCARLGVLVLIHGLVRFRDLLCLVSGEANLPR